MAGPARTRRRDFEMAFRWQWQATALTLLLSVALTARAGGVPPAEPTDSDDTGTGADSNTFVDMSIEDLMQVDVRTAAGLTAFDTRRTPVDMTTLDARDIGQSGARDLN